MQLVQITVDDDQRESLTGVLEEQTIEYTVVDGHQEGVSVLYFAVPVDGVEHVLDDLFDAGLTMETYTIVTDAEFAFGENVEELQERFAKTPNRLAPQALRSKAQDLRKNTRAFVWMMILSSVIATAGLLIGSPAVVVGSMVIAPIVSPALATSVGAIRDDWNMFFDGVRSQALGLGIAVAGATAFCVAIRFGGFVPRDLDVTTMELIRLRLAPGLLSLVVGLAAGGAAAYGLATKGSASIVGVMIAAALIPTAATAGIAIAWVKPLLAVGSLTLLLINLIAINLAAYATFNYLEYQPGTDEERTPFVRRLAGSAVLVATVLLLAVVLVGTGVATYQQIVFERGTNDAVTAVLEQPEYADLQVVEIRTEYRGPVAFGQDPPAVTIVLSNPDGDDYPDLPDALRERITDRTDQDVVVRVQFVEFQRSEPAEASRLGVPGATAY